MLVGKIIGSSNLYRDSIIFYVLFDREDKMLFMVIDELVDIDLWSG